MEKGVVLSCNALKIKSEKDKTILFQNIKVIFTVEKQV